MTRLTVALPALVMAACAFQPGGDGTVDPDAETSIDGAVSDGTPAIDGAEVDAAAIDGAAIDARPIDAPGDPTCPVGYDVVAGASRFRFVVNNQPFGNATADCGNDGLNTHVATFEDPADLQTAMAGRGGSEEFWVAAVCDGLSVVDCDRPANWHWQPGLEPVDVAHWAVGQPNDTVTERNAIAFKEMGNWRLDNISGATAQAYVCECGD